MNGYGDRAMQKWNCWQKGGLWPGAVYKVLTCSFKNQHWRIPSQPPGPHPSCLLTSSELVENRLEATNRRESLDTAMGKVGVHLLSSRLWLSWPPLPFSDPDMDLAVQCCWVWTHVFWGVWVHDQAGAGQLFLFMCWESAFIDLYVQYPSTEAQWR